MAEERVEVELYDPEDKLVLRGTARVTRESVGGEMIGVDDYRTEDGRPMGTPPGYRWVLKLSTGETPAVEVDLDELLLRGDIC